MTVTTENMSAARAARPDREERFKDLFLAYYTRIYGVLYRLTGDAGQAEDLAQETFWRLWKEPRTPTENPGGWLYRVALNLAHNRRRTEQRRAHYETLAAQDESDRAELDPAHAAERTAEAERVRAVLNRMPPRDAQLLLLRHAGGSYQELAAALGLSPQSIGTLLGRAEAEFERLYAEEG